MQSALEKDSLQVFFYTQAPRAQERARVFFHALPGVGITSDGAAAAPPADTGFHALVTVLYCVKKFTAPGPAGRCVTCVVVG